MFFKKKERRIEPRSSGSQPVTVKVLPPGTPATITGKILDFSTSGLALMLSQFIMRGLAVEVQTPECALRATVLYCRDSPGGTFRVGLRIDGGL